MSKISPEHLARQAVVYIRQSTADQVLNNLESRRRQYGLADRARQLGWADVDVIDDDLGRSGSGVARPGFERLLAAICEGRVGAVVAIEASRLARNGRDWHTLLEFCGLVGTLIADEDGVYDPRLPNDRLLLGHERHDERDGAVDPAPALARGAQAKGAPRRTVHHGRYRLRTRPATTGSRRIRIRRCARRSLWYSGNSPKCRACGRFICGSGRRVFRLPAVSYGARWPPVWTGSCQFTTPSITS